MSNVRTLDPDKIIEESIKNSEELTRELQLLLVYKEIVTGEGLEFDRLREYVPGDEARMIDWNSLARTSKLYTKIFREERLLDVLIVSDLSGTMSIGTTDIVKNGYASIISATLARTALNAGDRAGYVGFSDDIDITIPPSQKDEVVYEIAHETSSKEVQGGDIDWQKVGKTLLESYSTETFVFIISDFIPWDSDLEEFLLKATERFKGVFTIMVRDPLDSRLPEGVGKAYMSDPATGEKILINVDETREEYNRKARQKEEKVKETVKTGGGHFFKTYTDEDFLDGFAEFIERRRELWR